MKNKKRSLLYLCTILLVVAVIAACSSAATSTPAAPTAAPAATTPPPATPTTAPAEATPSPQPATASEEMGSMETMKPSNGNTTPGPAITQNLQGDPASGAKIFAANCQKCHGEEGVGGVENPGSTEGTMPSLNPVDEDMGRDDPKVFALTLDLFIEHGSTPEGDNPKEVMPAWGDDMKLTPQQIADVIAYVMSLNTK